MLTRKRAIGRIRKVGYAAQSWLFKRREPAQRVERQNAKRVGGRERPFGLDMLALLYRLTCVELEQWNPLGGSISHHTPFVLAQNEKNNHCSWLQCRPVFSCHAEAVHEVVGVHCRHFRDDLCSVTLTVTAFRPCAGTTS